MKYEKPMEDLKIQKSRKIQKKLVESLKEITINSRNDFNRWRKNEEQACPETNFRKRNSDLPR